MAAVTAMAVLISPALITAADTEAVTAAVTAADIADLSVSPLVSAIPTEL
jgi:hypothetical protein